MPQPAVKPEVPPIELRDRQEGYGLGGHIRGYPAYKDDFEWPAVVVHNDVFEEEPTETSDPRVTGWWRVEDQGDPDINDYQGTPYVI